MASTAMEPNADPGGGVVAVEGDLGKECHALGLLFQQIVNELKIGVPHFDEFVAKAGKLHSTLKTTIAVLGSFLDTFQKIADAATNTKGATRDIGTCLTRIVIRHRALESRMKTLAGAVLDCLMMPVQNKLEEWKKVASALDKDHAKEIKKYRAHIKKKSEQVSRLKKKLYKNGSSSSSSSAHHHPSSSSSSSSMGNPVGSVADPSVQRLVDSCTKELNVHFRTLRHAQRVSVRRAMTAQRARYCTFVACLTPVMGEEMGCFEEVAQLEDVMAKLGKVTTNPASLPDTCEQIMEDVRNGDNGDGGSSLCLATPPSTPTQSNSNLGPRKNSMSSIASLSSTVTAGGCSTTMGSTSTLQEALASSSSALSSPCHSAASIAVPSRPESSLHSSMTDTISLSGSIRLSTISSYNGASCNNDGDNTSYCSSIAAVMSPDQGCKFQQRPPSVASAAPYVRSSSRPGSATSGAMNRHSAMSQPHSTQQTGFSTLSRPHTISAAFSAQHAASRPQITSATFLAPEAAVATTTANSVPVSPTKQQQQQQQQRANASLFEQSYSTIKRVYSNRSPFRRPSGGDKTSDNGGRPPLPLGGRAASLERPVSAMAFGGGRSIVLDPENNHVQIVSFGKEGNGNVVKSATMSPTHYAVPRGGNGGGGSLRLPDFNMEKTDMVIPQPVYMNSSDAVRMKVQAASEIIDDDDLKTPTVEELAFPGLKADNPPLQMMSTSTDGDGGSSTSSSGSIGSSEQSSGYGSQNAIVKPFNNDGSGGAGRALHRISETARNSNAPARVVIKPLQNSEPQGSGRCHYHAPTMTSAYARPSGVPSAADMVSSILKKERRVQMRRSDSFSPGYVPTREGVVPCLQRSSSHLGKPIPPPPIRRTPSMSSASALKDCAVIDEDATPHGSIENIPRDSCIPHSPDLASAGRIPPMQTSGFLTRSTSMCTGSTAAVATAPSPAPFGPRDQFARRSLTMSSKGVSFAPNVATVMNAGGEGGASYRRVSTHHVIPVSGGGGAAGGTAFASGSKKLSPDGEIYGFGMRFRENTRHYFGNPHCSGAGPSSLPTVLNEEAVQNQLFLDQLSAKLTGSPSGAMPVTSALPPPVPTPINTINKSKRDAEIENAALRLKRTPSVNDRSAPKLQ